MPHPRKHSFCDPELLEADHTFRPLTLKGLHHRGQLQWSKCSVSKMLHTILLRHNLIYIGTDRTHNRSTTAASAGDYDRISYAWNNEGPSVFIKCNGQSYVLTELLHAAVALRSFVILALRGAQAELSLASGGVHACGVKAERRQK
jgi:hypothetical protein